MPTVSMIYGVLASTFFGDDYRHHIPYIHARCHGSKALVEIETVKVMADSQSEANSCMLLVWIDIHKDNLHADWESAKSGEQPSLLCFEDGEERLFGIAPLFDRMPYHHSSTLFNQAKVKNGTVVWPWKKDIDPETLRDGSTTAIKGNPYPYRFQYS